jgi:hypothetical protein
MSYGSAAYGAAAYGGSAGSDLQVFFALRFRDPGILYESRAEFTGSSEFYEILTRQADEEPNIEFKIYTSHGEGETPQLQTTVGAGGPTQSIIAAAPIIIVTAEMAGITVNGFEVVGHPYTQ